MGSYGWFFVSDVLGVCFFLFGSIRIVFGLILGAKKCVGCLLCILFVLVSVLVVVCCGCFLVGRSIFFCCGCFLFGLMCFL